MKIDFYILETPMQQKCWLAVCQLIEKIVAEQKKIYIHFDSREEAERLDSLLWTYQDNSFIPHQLYQTTDLHPPLVQLGFDQPPSQTEIFINLAQTIPSFYHQFDRIIEFVFPDPSMQQLARDRYRQYKQHGGEIMTHRF